MIQSSKRRLQACVATTGAAALLLAGCGQANNSGDGSDVAEGPVTIEFSTWIAGADVLVEEWNATHPDIQVELTETAGGAEAYAKLSAAVAAGTAPDLAQVEYSRIPTFAIDGILQDVSALTTQYENAYLDWAWQGAGFLDQHYGIPNDAQPMVMYYNAAVFDEHGIEVPDTWEAYRSAGEALQEADPSMSIGSFLTTGDFFAGVSWQAGADWFEIADDAWNVSINGTETEEAIAYWTELAQDGLVNVQPGLNPGFWQALDSGQVATVLIGVWGYRGMKGNLQESAGDWRVATLPNWDAGQVHGANYGGSSWAVVEGAEHPEEALEFANWMASDPVAMQLQYENSGYYPSTLDPSSVEGFGQPDEFFGGQSIGDVLEEAAASVDPNWQWGPNMGTVNTTLIDGLTPVRPDTDVTAVLQNVNQVVVDDLESAGLSVN